jgi:acetylornithine deacetylase
MDAVTILAKLVSFDTTSSRSNLALVEWVANCLDRHGCCIRLTYDDARTKANLLAMLGPSREGGILLSGHSDVVPVNGQAWLSDPFALSERNGRLYGRGVADMKGFVACCLEQLRNVACGDLEHPIYLALSYDEELGCIGVPRLIADLLANCPIAAAAIVGEPTQMRIGQAHKGTFVMRTRLFGREAHSSDPSAGLSAIEFAARFVQRLCDYASELSLTKTALSCLEPAVTTFNIGQIEGGTALNIVPARCIITWEFRPIPEVDHQAIQERVDALGAELRRCMQQRVPEADIQTEIIAAAPPLRWQPANTAEALVRELAGTDAEGIALSFGSEAGLFQTAGIPTVVCGPGSIDQAHKPNEWLAID